MMYRKKTFLHKKMCVKNLIIDFTVIWNEVELRVNPLQLLNVYVSLQR